MITVLQIIPNMSAGGAEQACIDISAGLHARGDRAIVMAARGTRVPEIERAGGAFVARPVQSKNPFVIIKNALWLRRFIRKERVDIVHVRSRAPAWSGWLACLGTPCRYMTTFHAVYKFSNPFKKFYNRIMTRGARIIAISHYVANHMREVYGIDEKKIRVIYRGIDVERFNSKAVVKVERAALCDAWNVKEGQSLILLPARLSSIKGQDLLIEAMALLPNDLDVVAIILGDDQGRVGYREKLERLIRDKWVQDRVRLVAHCSNMPAAYSLAKLVVMPSYVPEGFGRVPVEAMAMGVPVIASALGATNETVVEGETGWLLPPENPQAWADAIVKALKLSEEKKKEMAQAAKKRAREMFDVRKMVSDTLAVYDELVKHG